MSGESKVFHWAITLEEWDKARLGMSKVMEQELDKYLTPSQFREQWQTMKSEPLRELLYKESKRVRKDYAKATIGELICTTGSIHLKKHSII